MSSKVNLKARIERHSRVIKNNLWNVHPFRTLYYKFNFNIVIALVLVLFPIYPIFAGVMYDKSSYDFYRGDIDESSIIEHYQWTDETGLYNISSNQYFLSVNSIVDKPRDLSSFNKVIDYEVKSWDSIASISQNFNLNNNTIYWANNLTSNSVLHPGDILKILPVDGLLHFVVEWDTLDSIALKYKVSKENIIKQNELSWDSIVKDTFLIIPWAIKEIPVVKKVVPVVKKAEPVKKAVEKVVQKQAPKVATSNTSVQAVKWNATLRSTWRNTFVRWNCTRYVANHKNITWFGNANQWLSNARAQWVPTWSEARAGAIISFSWRWYNPRYGHVWIVSEVNWDTLIVTDMNYRALWEVTVRKVDINDPAIKWYIYVD